jgi:hypothetical protein
MEAPERVMPMLLVAAAQIAVGVAFYRARKVNGWQVGDWLVLYTPVLFGIVANFLLLRVPIVAEKYGVSTPERAVGMSSAIAVIALFVTLFVSVNVFGS